MSLGRYPFTSTNCPRCYRRESLIRTGDSLLECAAPTERPDRMGGRGCGAVFQRDGEDLVRVSTAGDYARRALCLALVIASSWSLLACTSVDVQCGMRTDYSMSAAVPESGRTTIAWIYGAGFSGRQYGEMIDAGDVRIVRLAGSPPDFNDVCGLARLGHEVAHAMGGRHQ